MGLPAKSKLDIAPAMSSSVNVLNSSDVNSANSSSGEVGTEMPPKSVRCVQSQ